MTSNDFQKTNQYMKNEKICPTLEAIGVITAFIQRQQSPTNLLGSTLDLEVGASIILTIYLALKYLSNHRPRRSHPSDNQGAIIPSNTSPTKKKTTTKPPIKKEGLQVSTHPIID